MLEGGAIEEVRALIARTDIPASAPVRRAIGVGEIAGWLAGTHGREAALTLGRAATRQYAKRQYTWFRHQPPALWKRTELIEISENIAYIEILLQK
jgi:tRNA dimethylallyltransferase